MRHLWRDLTTSGGRFRPGDPGYRRAFLLNVTLLLSIALFLIIMLMNAIVIHQSTLSVIVALALTSIVAIFVYLRRAAAIEPASLAAIAVLTVVLGAYVAWAAPHRSYALYWIAVIPAISYALLGTKRAHIVVGLFGLAALAFVIPNYRSWPPTPP